MADATATTNQDNGIAQDVKVEDAGPARKRLTITIPADAIDSKFREAVDSLLDSTSLPGFRRGRAPRKLIERRFGPAIQDDAKNKLVAQAYASAIEENELKPLGEPEPDADFAEQKLEIGQPFTFALEIEVLPAFDLPSFDKLEIKKPVIEVAAEHIDNELQRQLLLFGEREKIESDFQQDDRIAGRVVVYKNDEDEAFYKDDNAGFVVPGADDNGRGHVLGLLIDDLAAMLSGKRLGDQLTFETTGPDTYEVEEVRGAKLRIEFEIDKAERIIPAKVEEIVERFNLGTEENLKQQVQLTLEQRRDREQETAMREQVYEFLLDAIDFDLPVKMSAAQVARTLERQRLELLYRGMPADEVESKLAELRVESEEQTRNRLKLSFIIARLADEFSIQVTEPEINGFIASIATQRGERPSEMKASLQKNGRLGEVTYQLRQNKTADHVISTANVTEIAADEWNKQFEDKARSVRKKTSSKKKSTKKSTTKKTSKKSSTKKKKTTTA